MSNSNGGYAIDPKITICRSGTTPASNGPLSSPIEQSKGGYEALRNRTVQAGIRYFQRLSVFDGISQGARWARVEEDVVPSALIFAAQGSTV